MAGEAAVGRLDRGDRGPFALGAVRTLDRRHRDRLRNLHPVAQGLAQAALRLIPSVFSAPGRAVHVSMQDAASGCVCSQAGAGGTLSRGKAAGPWPKAKAKATARRARSPTTTAIAAGCGPASWRAAALAYRIMRSSN